MFCFVNRDHATELHNFLSRSDYFDARVVAHAVDPLNLTESDPKGDLRGWSSGKPIAAHPSVRGFASHLVLLRQKLGDHAAAIRLILDVVHGELIFISVWAIRMTSCFVYRIRRSRQSRSRRRGVRRGAFIFLLSYWQLDTDVACNTHSGGNRAELVVAKARGHGRATETPRSPPRC